MIKKLLSTAALCALFGTASAQSALVAQPAQLTKQAVVDYVNTKSTVSPTSNQKVTTAIITDTLWYFFNKHVYRNASSVGFYTFPSPNTSGVTHFGSRFLNTGTITVTGLECVASRNATSPSASVTVRIYLANVSGGQPVLPFVDSVSVVTTTTSGQFLGGNFTIPKTITGDFAVVYKCVPTVAGDSAKVWMNNANTAASTTTVAGSKYGEGLGHLRFSPTFTNTTGLFGPGTDFEFLVAPRVGFQATAAVGTPTTSPLCTGTGYLFTQNSSAWFKNRQFNLNEFYRAWKPFLTSGLAPDSVYTWNFGDATGNSYPAANTTHTYAVAGTYNGTMTAMYQKMADNGTKAQDAATFSKTAAVCGGVQNLSGIDAISVYPNPSVSGNVTIANLSNENTIELYNMLGQSVYNTKADAGNFNADFSNLPHGTYFLKISAVNEKTKIVKLILN